MVIKQTGDQISIIIPTCGHFEDAFKPCIDRVIEYTDLSDKEIIVIANGCSNDITDKYCSRLLMGGYPARR